MSIIRSKPSLRLPAGVRTLPWSTLRWIAPFLLPLILYTLTLAPTVYNLDSAELTTAAYTLGLTRATGYPLYILVGHVWSWIPIRDVGYRMNLFSAFSGALTIFLLAKLMRRLNVGSVAMFGALGLLATTKFFWGLSLIAEVYTLQTALMAGLILCLLDWQRQPSPARTFLVGLLIGLGLCHHASQVLLLPAIAIFMFMVFMTYKTSKISNGEIRPWLRNTILAGSVGLILGLTFLLYLPLRSLDMPAFNYAGFYDATGAFQPMKLNTWSGLWALMSGKVFANLMFSYPQNQLPQELFQFFGSLWRSFMILGIGPGILGIAILFRRNKPAGLMLVLMFTAHVLFFANYRVLDKELMFLPAFVIWSIWLGIGYEFIIAEIRKRKAVLNLSPKNALQYIQYGVQLVIICGVVWSAIYHWPLADQSKEWAARQSGEAIMATAEKDALIVGSWDVIPILEYLQLVEGMRPDLQLVNRFLISQDDLIAWISKAIDQRPIYMDWILDGMPHSIHYMPEGPLYKLASEKQTP